MKVTEEGRIIFCKLSQLEKQFAPIDVIEDGMLILIRDLHS